MLPHRPPRCLVSRILPLAGPVLGMLGLLLLLSISISLVISGPVFDPYVNGLVNTQTSGSGIESPLALDTSTSLTGALPIAKGGTGATSAPTARTALGLGTAATAASSAFLESPLAANTTTSVTGAWPISKGGTGQTTQVAAIAALTETPCTMGDATQRTITAPDTSTRVTIKVDTDGANNTGTNLYLPRDVTTGTDGGYYILAGKPGGQTYLSLSATGTLLWCPLEGTSRYLSGTCDAGTGLSLAWVDHSNSGAFILTTGGTLSHGQTPAYFKITNARGGSGAWELVGGTASTMNPNAAASLIYGNNSQPTGGAAGGDIKIKGGNHGSASTTEGSVTIYNTNGTTKILECNESKVGFFGVAVAAQAAAITQTYSTADRTHAALTSATLTDSSGGTPGTTIAAIGASYTQAEVANAVASLAAQVNALRVDLEDTKQLLNAVIDDLQAYGLEQ
jgi:hypothetical protein